jgi:phosphatidylinositol kinase/protein kinase (PI-3  family)
VKNYTDIALAFTEVSQIKVASTSRVKKIRDLVTPENMTTSKIHQAVKYLENYHTENSLVHVPIMKFYKSGSEDSKEVHISKVLTNCMVFSSLARPKRLQYLGSDGVVYKVLCKSGDDLRKDMYGQELCQSISDAGLKINTYFIVVLGLAVNKRKEDENSGLIEWVENVSTFKSCLNEVYQITGTEYNTKTNFKEMPFEWPGGYLSGGMMHRTDAFQNMKYSGVKGLKKDLIPDDEKVKDKVPNWHESDKQEVMMKRFEKVLVWYKPVLGIHFRQIWPDPSVWYQNRRRFSETLATMSMVGYVLNLGDRHLENLVINESTGGPVHTPTRIQPR